MRVNNLNIPECYENFITVKGACDPVVPASDLYIENLPGISVQSAARIATAKHQSGVDLLNDKVIFAIQYLESEVQERLMHLGYNMPSTPFVREFCDFSKTQTIAPAPLKRGLVIRRNNLLAPFSLTYIDNIFVKSQTTKTTTIEIQDNLGNVLQTFPIELLANRLTTINVDFSTAVNDIRVVMDNTDVTVFKGQCSNGSCCHWDAAKKKWQFYSVTGFDGVRCDTKTYGIGVNAGYRCDLSQLMCYLLPYIRFAVLYKTGTMILEELLASDRLNSVISANKEWAGDTLPQWEAIVVEKLDAVIPAAMKQLLKKDQYCITCKQGNVKVVSNV
jgi:hypothetical protein